MPAETLIQLALFALATLYTPGPNNIMLANSGARFGFRRTLPHLFGVALGFAFMLFLMALGLGALFEQSPLFREVLRWVGAAVMLWIAWKIATAKRAVTGDSEGRPFTFLQAAGFQWINPKAWSMAIGVAGAYIIGSTPVLEAMICMAVFAALGIGSGTVWAAFGTGIRRFLSTDARFRAFNIVMGLLVAGCVAMLFMD